MQGGLDRRTEENEHRQANAFHDGDALGSNSGRDAGPGAKRGRRNGPVAAPCSGVWKGKAEWGGPLVA